MAKSKGTKALVRELALLLEETNISEIEIEEDGVKIRVARNTGGGNYVPATSAAPQAPPIAPSVTVEAPIEKDLKNAVKSPMVGTAYLSPEPGAENFVKVGDRVKAGQTLIIIEAMKVMNPITAPNSGTVSEVLVADADPVEFDQALIIID
jgi:acetyl-CoA carboxylase biotin carboxyl carrier protein